MLVAGGTFGDQCPITGSHEPAGVVAEVGEGVTEFKVGDRVIALNKANMCGESSVSLAVSFPISEGLTSGECWDCRHLDPA